MSNIDLHLTGSFAFLSDRRFLYASDVSFTSYILVVFAAVFNRPNRRKIWVDRQVLQLFRYSHRFNRYSLSKERCNS